MDDVVRALEPCRGDIRWEDNQGTEVTTNRLLSAAGRLHVRAFVLQPDGAEFDWLVRTYDA